jgi:hypothetical protein
MFSYFVLHLVTSFYRNDDVGNLAIISSLFIFGGVKKIGIKKTAYTVLFKITTMIWISYL